MAQSKASQWETERQFMRDYGRFLRNQIPPCPWNPFPRYSIWGRRIEGMYRRDELARRAAITKKGLRG